MRLRSGQAVARAMGLAPLKDTEMLIGKFAGDAADIKGDVVKVGGDAFKENYPPWTYVLAETQAVKVKFATSNGVKNIETRRLGPIGGRIVAEKFVDLLAGDSSSYLNQDPLWTPSFAKNGVFGLREFIATAVGS